MMVSHQPSCQGALADLQNSHSIPQFSPNERIFIPIDVNINIKHFFACASQLNLGSDRIFRG
jgi:hypothetical protein